MTSFDIERTASGGSTVVVVDGEVDLDTAGLLEAVLVKALETAKSPVIVDLTKCEFIDSTGLGTLVRANKQLNGLGPLVLVLSDPNILRVFEISHLDHEFAIYPSRAAALADWTASV